MTKTGLPILMATDVPFWHAKTGAEQRILSLAQYFGREPFELTTYYVGAITPDDHQAILDRQLNLVFFENEKPPAEFLSRLKWYVDATRHQIQRWMSRNKPSEMETATPPTPLTLDDYRWPWAIDQFRKLVERLRPRVFLAEYVTMGYLLEGIPARERGRMECILDTHDILHERGLQFGAAGYLHWLDIDRDQEIAVWNQFDTVLAIQEQEAALIRSLTKGPEVLVVGHAPAQLGSATPMAPPAPSASSEKPLRVGYIGSANHSNWHALNRFLIEVWPEVLANEQVQAEFVVAGKICQWLDMLEPDRRARLEANRVQLQGEVQTLGEFYRHVDIVVNPVQFGTGLKIKNVEALAYGKPLVTTASGADGLSDAQKACCLVTESLREMADRLVELCANPAQQQELSRKSCQVANQELSETVVYSELARHLLNSAKKDFQKQPSR